MALEPLENSVRIYRDRGREFEVKSGKTVYFFAESRDATTAHRKLYLHNELKYTPVVLVSVTVDGAKVLSYPSRLYPDEIGVLEMESDIRNYKKGDLWPMRIRMEIEPVE